MSWVTRCPSCTTVFRVAEDQLRVSEGYVRCGRCDAVFNAREHLFDLESGAPALPQPAGGPFAPPITRPAASTLAADPPPEFEHDTQPEFPDDQPEPETPFEAQAGASTLDPPDAFEPLAGQPEGAPFRQEPVFEEAGPAETPEFRAIDPEPSAQRMRELLGLTAEPLAAEPRREDSPAKAATTAPASLNSGVFASLDRPPPKPVRPVLGWGLAAALSLTLPLQWAWIERDTLRARWPTVEALWLQACGGCEPIALARLDGLSVASSSLQPTPQGQAYHLKVRIENRAEHAVRLPWLDLQLSDAEGQALLRRSLSPDELVASGAERIAAGSSVDLQATFQLDGRLAGYEIGLFYP